MASANVDLVRSIFADWERGAFASAGWAHRQVEYVFADGPAPGTWAGLAGMSEGFRDFLGAWEEYGVEAEEYRELDVERVLVLFRHRGRGRTSHVELGHVGAKGAMRFDVRDGKVMRIVVYFDRERALADLGLAPSGDASEASSSRGMSRSKAARFSAVQDAGAKIR